MLNSKLVNRPIADYFGMELRFAMLFASKAKDFDETYKEYRDMFIWIVEDSAEHSEPHIDACVMALADLVIEFMAIRTSPFLTEESFGQVLAEMKERIGSGRLN